MTFKSHLLAVLAVLVIVSFKLPLANSATPESALAGTWSGRVSSRNDASFSVKIVIAPNATARLVAEAAPCFSDADLKVTTSAPNSVRLAGRSKAGENVTFKGTIDDRGTQLHLTYIVNGSSSGRCEIDRGAGTLDKE